MELSPVLEKEREKYWKYYPESMMAFKLVFIKKALENGPLKSVNEAKHPWNGEMTDGMDEETWWFSLN